MQSAKKISQCRKVIVPTYFKGVTERIPKILKHHKIKKSVKLQTNFQNPCKLKETWRPEDIKNIVFKMKCKDCKSLYIGKSERSEKQRKGEHKQSVNKRGKMHKRPGDTG